MRFDIIRNGLERLRTAKRPPKVSGAEAHGFELNPPLSDSEVRSFEAKHHIRLPEDYRGFLINLGNGGAGPYYGVFKLGEMDDAFDSQAWQEDDGFVGVLSKPFPHIAAWNDLTGKPEETDDDAEYERALDTFDQHYWNPNNVNGAIPICHEGCALRDWLVVSGSEAGHIWHDARVDRAGLYPISIGQKKRITFLDWYVDWLNESLATLPNPCG
jgi:hypothetical protein